MPAAADASASRREPVGRHSIDRMRLGGIDATIALRPGDGSRVARRTQSSSRETAMPLASPEFTKNPHLYIVDHRIFRADRIGAFQRASAAR